MVVLLRVLLLVVLLCVVVIMRVVGRVASGRVGRRPVGAVRLRRRLRCALVRRQDAGRQPSLFYLSLRSVCVRKR